MNQTIEMTNVKHEVKGTKLVITVDLAPSKGTGLSLTSKGRSYQVATSNGFQKMSGEFADLAFSMNVIMDKKAYEAHLAAKATPAAPAVASKGDTTEVAALKSEVSELKAMMAQLMQLQLTK